MPFAIKLGEGQIVRIDELPLDLLEQAAKAHGARWSDFLVAPAKSVPAGRALINSAAGHLGLAAPDTSTAKAFLAAFEEVPDDTDEILWQDGLPKAEDASSTAG